MLMTDFANTHYTNSGKLFDELKTYFGSNTCATGDYELSTNKIKDDLMMVIMTFILEEFVKTDVSKKILLSKFV